MTEAAVYLRSAVDRERRDPTPPGITDALARAAGFAQSYGYSVVAWFQDVTTDPIPGATSAFVDLLATLDQGTAQIVLAPAREWLSPTQEAQRRMAEMIDAHGGTLVIVDAVEALGIAPRPDA